jgi:hypothetical protein
VEQELLTILEYLRSFSVLVGKYFVDAESIGILGSAVS